MDNSFQSLRIRQFDKAIASFEALRDLERPRAGWLRPLREALGMTQQQVADRLDVTKSMVSKYEKAEADGSISLSTLRRAAAALDAEVVCLVLPRKPIEELRKRRAREVARRHVDAVHRSMTLEDQAVSEEERRRQVEELAEQLVKDGSRSLWDETP